MSDESVSRLYAILVGRDGAHANDTYTGDAQVNGIKIALGAK